MKENWRCLYLRAIQHYYTTLQKKPEISAPKFAYIIHADGSAPIMSNLHVAFATKSVELLRERMTLTGKQLIEM
jgi:hypothetical protein